MTHQIVQKKEKWVAAVTYWLRYETRKYPNAAEPKSKVEETVTVEDKNDVDQVDNPPPRIFL